MLMVGSVRVCVAIRVVTLVVCTGLPVAGTLAQGGKAEPLRIQFERGRHSATVTGTLNGDAQREYAIGARSNQRLTIRVAAQPAGSVSIQVTQPSGVALPLQFDSKQTWSVLLPEDGEYEMAVKRVKNTAGRSQYRLTVTIR
jgi:hypothetical protein